MTRSTSNLARHTIADAIADAQTLGLTKPADLATAIAVGLKAAGLKIVRTPSFSTEPTPAGALDRVDR